MGSYRTSKVNQAYYDVFTVFSTTDGTTPVSGQTTGDFTVTFYLDGVAQAGITYTIAEIGTSGDYLLSVPAGFSAVGFWSVTVVVAYNGSTWRSHVEVRLHDIDDVYTVVAPGGFGVETVNITVQDASNGDALVPDALVYVYDATGTVLVTFDRTNTSGVSSILLDAGTYILRAYKPGFSADDYSITVTDTGGMTAQDFTYSINGIAVVAPSSPQLCRMYADFITQDGLPYENFKISVENLFDPESSSGLAVIESVRTYTTDAAGHLEFDVVRGTRVRVALLTTPLTRDIVVPDEAVQSLLTAFGAATDAFQLVKRT